MCDQLRRDLLGFDVPHRAGGVQAGSGDKLGICFVPVEGGNGSVKLLRGAVGCRHRVHKFKLLEEFHLSVGLVLHLVQINNVS